ncbi:MAG: glycosyltransferase [Planctomycetia bacterium]
MVESTSFFIAIPARNAARHVAAALESVASQDLTGIRVHVHVQDGGSTDGTLEIVRAWSMRFAGAADSPALAITWATAADGGMYDAITTAIDAASGRIFSPDVFFWLNADDILMPGALRNLAATFANPAVEWVIGAAVDLDEAGAVTVHKAHPRIPDADLRGGNFNYTGGRWLRAESTAVRFAVARACGPFTAGLRLAGDYDLFVKLARRGPPSYVDYPVRGFRRHAGQLSQAAVAYQCERARARFFLSEADPPRARPRAAVASLAHEIVFYPDRTAIDPYQSLLYAGARARGAASIQDLAEACLQATTPLVVHVHWLDQIVAQPQAAAVADARSLAQTLTVARARGHRVVFTMHDVTGCTHANADVEEMLVQFLFGHASLVHLHHPVAAAEIRGRFQSFPWGRTVFAEHGPYPDPGVALRSPAFTLVGADGAATTTIREARWAVLGPGSAPSAGLLFHILAAGTPVIAPRLGRIPAYVFDGVNGFLYDPGDEASYRQAVERALADRSSEARHALSQQAVRAVADLDWPTTLDTIMRRLT